jgi:L-gulonate 5-dehydrogenase
MKALVYTGVESLEYQDFSDATPTDGELLVKVHSCGICGSDMHAFLGHDERRSAPLILGHEVSGHIVGGKDDGERVTVNPLVACGACPDCLSGHTNLCANREIISMVPRQGGFTEFISMPRQNLITVPDDMDMYWASLVEPLACGWHAVKLASSALRKPLGDIRSIVIGGGAIGVGSALALRAMGAEDISILETNPLRCQRLEKIDGFKTLSPSGGDATKSGRYDLIIDAVGFQATRAVASEAVRAGGVIVHIGLGQAEGGLDIRRMTLQEIQFIGSYTYTAVDFRETAQAVFDQRFGSLDWIETRDLQDGHQAFVDIRNGSAPEPKIILVP